MPQARPEPNPKGRAPIQFPQELPITSRVRDIIAALTRHQVVIVAGATGSGKTTQLPKIALEMGRGGKKQIGVTQPRRIAATSVAARVARELQCELGNEVGYQIRFEDRTSNRTWVKFMTDGILLAEIQGDRKLSGYDTLIIDEAHERSLTIDFLLGWLKRILPSRPDLKVIISSATIETSRFSEFFSGAPVIQVEGRTFPVEVLYEPPDGDLDLPEAVANAVENVTTLDPRGDILVFLPGEREIRETEQLLAGKGLRHTLVQPLYARLSAADQSRVFASISQRRIILATNVAETSLTIPGIVYVVDAGLARLSRYDSRTGTTRLQVEAISQASADQRKGRCGRVRDGICVRLYDEQDFVLRPEFTDPEIKRTGLAGVILRMKSLGLGEVEEFPFLDPPNAKSVTEGYRVLQELGALTEERDLTDLGRLLARFPVDPRVARMIVAASQLGSLKEILVIAAALNIQDPRERPRGQEAKADQLHQRFRDEQSDFLGLIRLWDFVREQEKKGSSQLRRACKENFLSFPRIREWGELHKQLEQLVSEQQPSLLRTAELANSRPTAKAPVGDALHLALLSGLLSRVGMYNSEQRVYLGARQTRFALHPSSTLAKKPPAWLMAFELVETSQLFARMAAKIEPLWLDQVGSHLLKRSYSDPHWSEKSARASVREHATLFGLPVLKDRSVDYASISPVLARKMFIEHALVRGEFHSRGLFQDKNRQRFDEIAALRDKARQSDMLADDERLFAFFDERVPVTVVNGKTFEAWRETAEKGNSELLWLSYEDILAEDMRLQRSDYPDRVGVQGVELEATYCFDPTAADDGVTLHVPLTLLPQLDSGELDYTIPAWHKTKIAALLNELPRALKRDLGPIGALVEKLAPKLSNRCGPLLPALSRAVLEATAVSIPEEAFRPDAIPAYLHFNCRIVGERGAVVAEGRDVSWLVKTHAPVARELLRRTLPPSEWQRSGIVKWDFGDLPDFVSRTVQGTLLRSFPCAVDRETSVSLALLESEGAAEIAHRGGLRRLIALQVKGALTDFAKRAPAPLIRRGTFPPSRSEREAFSNQLISCVLDNAFGLDQRAPLPRNKTTFDALLASGTPKLKPTFEQTVRALSQIAVEYERVQLAIENAAKQPSGANVAIEVREQVEHLLPGDWLGTTPLSRFPHLPRYLVAAQSRLQRAVQDPRKDAGKAVPLVPLWKLFLAKKDSARDREKVDQIRWTIEELRIALFAPELKPVQPVTIAGLKSALECLR